MTNPYSIQPKKSFWRSAVGDLQPTQISGLWQPKFSMQKHESIATLGSCFAQHISRALIDSGYTWFNSEPAPRRFPEKLKMEFNYDVFSARVGNIYTTALLKQWVFWAFNIQSPPDEVWEMNGRYYDPFRPNIQPNGFVSTDEVLATRNQTIVALRQMFENCRTFVYTLGLTEAWVNTENGIVYPMCPGTVAGVFDENCHSFKNYRYNEVFLDLQEVIRVVKENNPKINFLLTVSPVPLTATATADHVLVATVYSKSTLRAVAGDMASAREDTDYFPSFEMISSFPFKGQFYESNMRSVSKVGVSFVMKNFISQLAAHGKNDSASPDSAVQDWLLLLRRYVQDRLYLRQADRGLALLTKFARRCCWKPLERITNEDSSYWQFAYACYKRSPKQTFKDSGRC
jgi:GSCFA family